MDKQEIISVPKALHKITGFRISLHDTELNEIALELGFYDQSYFSKVFSRKYGRTPSEFRSSAQRNEIKGELL